MKPNQNNPSNRDPSSDDERDDVFIQQLLNEHVSVDPPDPQFVKQLSQRLDDEFKSMMASDVADSANSAGTTTLPIIDQGMAEQYPDEDIVSTRPTDRSVSDSGTRLPRFGRWFSGTIAAVILLGFFSLWLVQPPTSWAEMIKALNTVQWVQTDSGRTSSWVSASNQVVARREVDQTVFTSRQSGKQRTSSNKKQAFYHQNRFSELEHSVCFPFVILKIYWLKHKSHDYPWRRIN